MVQTRLEVCDASGQILGIREYDDSFWNGGDAVSHGLHPRCDPWWVPLGAPRTKDTRRNE